jgi:RHS repeat-associated protein
MTLHKKLLVIGLSLSVTIGGVPAAWSQTNKVPSATAPDTSPSMPMPWWKTSATTPATNSTGAYQCSNTGAGPTDTCPSPGAGNPINIMSGNKYQREEDMPALPGVLGLEIVRHYNSFFSTPGSPNGIMGRGWKLSYETELHVTGRVLQLTQADGTRVIFNRDPLDQSLCASANPADGRIVIRKTARGDEYTLVSPNGRKLDFNSQGKLTQILAPTGEFVTLQYDVRGMLQKVIDPQGRTLQLRYLDKAYAARGDHFTGVVAIHSPVGRFTYEYGSELPKGATLDKIHVVANLVKVGFPTHYDSKQKLHAYTDRGVTSSSISRIYHYEDPRHPTLLTGITASGTGSDGQLINQRIGTYGYNANGLGILTVKGEPARFVTDKDGKPVQPPKAVEGTGMEQVTIDYRQPGQTVIKNSLGQETVYNYANTAFGLRLLEVRGAGCATCGEANMRYRYDRMGRLVEITRLTPAGQPIQTTKRELDYYGRVLKVSNINYRGGKPGKEQWLLRYEYQIGNPHPKLIARPSVVPGLEVQTRIAYGNTDETQLLPLQITESGYSPTMDGKSAAGALVRTMSYRYNSEGQRIETDGPLANAKDNAGPDNSDITRSEYDPRTKLVTRRIAPGNIVTEVIERDEALRPVKVRTSDGYSVQTATIRNNWRGQPEEISIEAERLSQGQSASERSTAADNKLIRTLRYRYDANGRLTSVTLPGNLTTRFKYDAAGHLMHRLLPDGSLVAMERDTEGRTQAINGYADSSATTGNALTTVRYQYDDWNRVARIDDAQGMRGGYQYTESGQIAAITNTLGIAMRFEYDADGLLIARVAAANSPDAAITKLSYDSHGQPIVVTDPNGVTTQQRYDDFGRKIAEVSPDRGITLYRYDVAGRLIAKIDETQTTTRYSYDHVNRLVTLGADKELNLVQYRYQGKHLIEVVGTIDGNVEHATERTNYQYNALGALIQETRWISRVDALQKWADAEQKNASAKADKTGKTPWSLPGLTFITRNEYDDAGRMIKQILPDGHRLTYRYNPVGDKSGNYVRKTASRPSLLSAILFDDKPIVTDIDQAQAGGLVGYRMGNGIQQGIKLDGSGRIEKLQSIAQLANEDGSVRKWLKDLFGDAKGLHEKIVYSQSNRYDVESRVIEISRTYANPSPEQPPRSVTEHYDYDAQNRLVKIQDATGTSRIRYDRGGNRIAELVTPFESSAVRPSGTTDSGTASEQTYHYMPGTNRLVAIIEGAQSRKVAQVQRLAAPRNAEEASRLVRSVWFYHETGVPLARLSADDTTTETKSNRIVYNTDKRPISIYDAHDRLIARYYYNGRGERIAKTTFPRGQSTQRSAIAPTASVNGDTSYYLYSDRRLAAETDSDGRIKGHYVYLYGKPVAKIEVAVNTDVIHTIWRTFKSLGGMIKSNEGNHSHSRTAIYAIHTDHLGMPQVVTDAQQQVVWQVSPTAFGQAHVVYAKGGLLKKGERFEMRLRLPGQVYDKETNLHYNYYRDYDPVLGRYVTSDPIGLSGGDNPYTYVGSDPLNNIDPLGLYSTEVHYYMTYFLARLAGIETQEATTIALAAQYIDDNPNTEPINLSSPFSQAERLRTYHFTQAGYDPKRMQGESEEAYAWRRVENPWNPQLQKLYNPVNRAPNQCAKAQFFGEFLHAFEDTFAHRDRLNDAINVNNGLGHAGYGENPDYTYNHGSLSGWWGNNEQRTYRMEQEVFARMIGYSSRIFINSETGKPIVDSSSGKQLTYQDVFGDGYWGSGGWMSEFNAMSDRAKKLLFLEQKLDQLGLGPLPLYNKAEAQQRRRNNFQGLDETDYPGTIMATP